MLCITSAAVIKHFVFTFQMNTTEMWLVDAVSVFSSIIGFDIVPSMIWHWHEP